MSRSKSSNVARHESPYINARKNKEPSLLDQLLCFGDDLMDTIDESLGLSSYEDSVTSSSGEDSTNDGKDTVLERYEKSIRSKEKMNDEETEASEVTSLVEEESRNDDTDEVSPRRKRSKKKMTKKNEARVDPEGNYLHQNLRNTYKKQQTKNERYGASTNKVKNEDHFRFALDEHDVVMEMMMKQNAIAADLYKM
eukprot:scaffold6638_cov120-Skeletonema_menzelii.AAC.4